MRLRTKTKLLTVNMNYVVLKLVCRGVCSCTSHKAFYYQSGDISEALFEGQDVVLALKFGKVYGISSND